MQARIEITSQELARLFLEDPVFSVLLKAAYLSGLHTQYSDTDIAAQKYWECWRQHYALDVLAQTIENNKVLPSW